MMPIPQPFRYIDRDSVCVSVCVCLLLLLFVCVCVSSMSMWLGVFDIVCVFCAGFLSSHYFPPTQWMDGWMTDMLLYTHPSQKPLANEAYRRVRRDSFSLSPHPFHFSAAVSVRFFPESSQREIHQLPLQLPHHREYIHKAGCSSSSRRRVRLYKAEMEWIGHIWPVSICTRKEKRWREKCWKKTFGFKVRKKGVVAVVGLSNHIPNGVLLRSSRLYFHHDVAQNKISPPPPNQKFIPSKRRNPCLFVLGVYNNTNIELRD